MNGPTNQPETDVREIVVTLPNGKIQAFRESDGGRVYIKGSTQYWSDEQFAEALAKMKAAGATVEEHDL